MVPEQWRNHSLLKAKDSFIEASNKERDAARIGKSKYYVGICHDLLKSHDAAQDWFEGAYYCIRPLEAEIEKGQIDEDSTGSRVAIGVQGFLYNTVILAPLAALANYQITSCHNQCAAQLREFRAEFHLDQLVVLLKSRGSKIDFSDRVHGSPIDSFYNLKDYFSDWHHCTW